MKTTLLEKIERRFQPARERILIVDDEKPVLALYRTFFEQRGYRLTTTVSLSNAEILLSEQAFDVILLDVMLPDGNGVDFLPRIRSLQPKVPVIVLSGMGYDDEFLNKALENGAADYVSKWLPLDQLLMEIHGVLKARKAVPAIPEQTSPPPSSGGQSFWAHTDRRL